MGKRHLFVVLCNRGSLILPAVFLISLSFGLLGQEKVRRQTDYFAAVELRESSVLKAETTLRCDQVKISRDTAGCEHGKPPNIECACVDGSKMAGKISSYSVCVGAILAFIFQPLVGSYSDEQGRKKFLIVTHWLCTIPPLLFLLFILGKLTLWPYIYTSTLSVGFLPLSLHMAYMADCLEKKYRSSGFAVILTAFLGPYICGSSIQLIIGDVWGAILALAAAALSLICVFVVPESLSPEAMLQAKGANFQENIGRSNTLCTFLLSPFHKLAILTRNLLRWRLAWCLCFQYIGYMGLDSLLIYYYMSPDGLSFSQANIARLTLFFGICSILVQLFAVPVFVRHFGNRVTMIIGLLCGCLGQLILAISGEFYQIQLISRNSAILLVVVSSAVSSISLVIFPAIGALKSNDCLASEQGQIQGAIAGVRSLSSFIG
eukprot:g166.t1